MTGYIVAGVCVAGLLAAVIGGCCRKYTMKFDTNGVAFDEEIKDVKARRGQEISLPELSSSKHEFLGWFLDPACTEKFDGKMRGDVTLYAGWKSNTATDKYHEDFLGLVEALLSDSNNCLNHNDLIYNAVLKTLPPNIR